MQEWFFWSYSAALAVSAICILMVFRQKPGTEQKIMQITTFFIGITMIGYWLHIQSESIDALLISQKLIYLGGCHLYYFMTLFIMRYCNLKMHKHIKTVLVIINCIMTWVALTLDNHTLLYRSYYMVKHNDIYILKKEYGPFHKIYILQIILYSSTMLLIAIRHMKKSGKQRLKKSILLLLVVFFPTFTYLSQKATGLDCDLVPYGLIIGLILMLYLMYIEKIYDVQDTAKDFAFSSMDDALIVLDSQYRYKGCNKLAQQIFPELKNALSDIELKDISQKLLNILINDKRNDINYNKRIYEPIVKELHKNNKLIGKVLWLYDVTKHRQHMKLLENYQKDLESEVDKKTSLLQKIQEDIILGFANIIESRDHITGGHIKRTSGYVQILVDRLKLKKSFCEFQNVSFARHICLAAPLHDIGKIAIPDNILNKPGALEPDEFEIMKNHTILGSEILDNTLSTLEDQEYYKLSRDMAEYHHEKYDGTGYPTGLKGKNIPVCARIMAIADVFDALTSKRSYKEGFPPEKAFEMIKDGKLKQFDPDIVDAFLEAKKEIMDFYKNNH